MKVGIDAGPLFGPPTGIGRYATELIRELPGAGVEVLPYAVTLRGTPPPHLEVTRWKLPARTMQTAWRRLGHPSIKRLVPGAEIVHGTNYVLPALGGLTGVVTVPDLSFYRNDTFPGGDRLRELVPWSTGRAAAVIVLADALKDEVADRYALDADRVHVTHLGVGPEFFGAAPLSAMALGRMGIPGPFVLAVGTIEPRKNLRRLLNAWAAIRSQLDGWRLVLAGPKGWGESLPETEGVMLLGWIPDETLPGLLAAADVFCYPSLYEGFGLPPLEAMATGTATVVGRYGAASEVLGDAACLVDPLEVDDLAEGLLRVATDGSVRRDLELKGRAQAARYTWTATARATVEAYKVAIA